jgi:hypothetical protein
MLADSNQGQAAKDRMGGHNVDDRLWVCVAHLFHARHKGALQSIVSRVWLACTGSAKRAKHILNAHFSLFLHTPSSCVMRTIYNIHWNLGPDTHKKDKLKDWNTLLSRSVAFQRIRIHYSVDNNTDLLYKEAMKRLDEIDYDESMRSIVRTGTMSWHIKFSLKNNVVYVAAVAIEGGAPPPSASPTAEEPCTKRGMTLSDDESAAKP